MNNIDDSLLEEIESHAVSIAREAGHILLEHFRKPLEVDFKSEKKRRKSDPVTTADRSSDEFLRKAVKEKFPGHNILSEEEETSAKGDSPFYWVIDPLDGTTNFMNGLPLFAVSVGVLWNRQPVAGSIYVPVGHHAAAGIYHTRLGKGTFLDDERINISRETSGLPLAGNPSLFGKRLRLSRSVRREPRESRNLGSIALELALTAAGVLRYAMFGSPKLWDVAAGILLVKEAGGSVFTRQAKDKQWCPFEQFELEVDKDTGEQKDLRKWTSPIIAGESDFTTKLVTPAKINLLTWLKELYQPSGHPGRRRPHESGKGISRPDGN